MHLVRMPVGFGKHAIKSRGRPLSVMTHLKTSIVEVKAEEYYLAHALVISIAKVGNDPNYKAHIHGRKIRQVVQTLLETTGIDLSNGAEIPEFVILQENFRLYKIVVYRGLSCEDIIFEGQVDSPKRVNILYDDIERNYQVIAELTAAMAKKYVCKGAKWRVHATSRTSANRRVAIACSVRRAHSRRFESHATTSIGTLETPRVSRITICTN